MLDNGNAKVENLFGKFSIIIPCKKNPILILFFLGWALGLFMVLKSFNNAPNDVSDFLTIWTIGWSINGLLLFCVFLWNYFGLEVFEIINNEVRFERTVFGIGIKKTLDAKEINNIHFQFVETNVKGRYTLAVVGLGKGKIVFDYGMKTYSFGLAVDDAEAHHLVDIMKEYFSKNIKSNSMP